MSENQFETEQNPLNRQQPKGTPCIFGKAIIANCPVMQALKTQPEINKYLKAPNEILDTLISTLETVSSHFATIHYFCTICPFLQTYKEEKP